MHAFAIWLIILAVLLATLLGWSAWERRRRSRLGLPKRSGGASVALMIGMVFSALLDPKSKITTEQVESNREKRRTEAGRENE